MVEAIRRLRACGQYRHKVTLCRGRTFAVDAGAYLRKDEVFSAKADIREVRGSFFAGGFAIQESRNVYSHNIFIRVAPKFDITGSAWVYEERHKTPSRWYKVLQIQDFNETGREYRLLCRLVEKSDDAEPPATPGRDSYVALLPVGLKL